MGTRKETKENKISVVVPEKTKGYGEFKWLKWQDKMRKEKKNYRNEDKIYNSHYVIQ